MEQIILHQLIQNLSETRKLMALSLLTNDTSQLIYHGKKEQQLTKRLDNHTKNIKYNTLAKKCYPLYK